MFKKTNTLNISFSAQNSHAKEGLNYFSISPVAQYDIFAYTNQFYFRFLTKNLSVIQLENFNPVVHFSHQSHHYSNKFLFKIITKESH
jgi:hypothetical protein